MAPLAGVDRTQDRQAVAAVSRRKRRGCSLSPACQRNHLLHYAMSDLHHFQVRTFKTLYLEDLPKERRQTGAPPDTYGQEPRVLLARERCLEAPPETCRSTASRNRPRSALAATQTQEVPNKR